MVVFLILVVLIIVNITTPSISWLLLNNKFAYATATSAYVRVNGKDLYATAASARSTNKLTTAAAAAAAITVSSAPPPAKTLPSLTRSLSSIKQMQMGSDPCHYDILRCCLKAIFSVLAL